jgi:uncharacterized Ntn-hydrolase superfamily protein
MTFSIAGICARTGQIGFAVTTSSVAVGARVGAALAHTGVVLSQARTDPRLNTVGLRRIAAGASAREALEAMVGAAVGAQWRQLGVLLADGTIAVHTGGGCTEHGGHVGGTRCLALGNALQGHAVLDAMVACFEAGEARPLCDRLIAALAAGAGAGGEWTALQSSSVRVFTEDEFPYVDLRVDKSATPIADLARLWEDFAPKADAYRQRALDPEHSPPATEIEAPARG